MQCLCTKCILSHCTTCDYQEISCVMKEKCWAITLAEIQYICQIIVAFAQCINNIVNPVWTFSKRENLLSQIKMFDDLQCGGLIPMATVIHC